MKNELTKARTIGLSRPILHRTAAFAAVAILACGTAYARVGTMGAGRGMDDDTAWANIEKDDAAAPDYKQQRFLFGTPDKKTSAEQMAYARSLEKEGRSRAARKAYNALVHQWGDSPEAAGAQLSVAVLYELAGNHKQAFREYQYFIENYSLGQGTEDVTYDELIQGQFAIANVMRGKLGSGWFSSPGSDLVGAMYRHIVENAPEWERAPECMFYAASSYEGEKNYQDAITVYESLVARYPSSGLRVDALYRAASCRYNVSQKYPRDERIKNNALASLSRAIRADSEHKMAKETSARIAELSQSLAQMNFEKAEFYDRIRKNPKAAVVAYSAFAERFPASSYATAAKKRIAELKPLADKADASPPPSAADTLP